MTRDRTTSRAGGAGAGRAAGAGHAADAPSRGNRGFEIVLIAVYGIFAISATARSLVQMLRDFSFAPVAYVLSLLAAVTYIAVTVALVRGGRRSAPARLLCLAELAGVLVVGTLTFVDPSLFPDATVWGHFGQGYGFVPLVLPMAALLYLRGGVHRTGASGPVA